MSPKFFAQVMDGPRRDQWLRFLGTDTMPIVSSNPVNCHVPGYLNIPAYLIDFAALDAGLQAGVVQLLCAAFNMNELEVKIELLQKSYVPVLADGVVVKEVQA